jgi:hypothetical protein
LDDYEFPDDTMTGGACHAKRKDGGGIGPFLSAFASRTGRRAVHHAIMKKPLVV